MGNESLFSTSNELDQVLTRFQVTHRYPEKSVIHLADRRSGQEFVMRQLTTNNQQERTRDEALATNKLASRSPYIIRLTERIGENRNNYCSSQFKLYLIFQRPFKDLRTEILDRRARAIDFSEDELLAIIRAGVLGLKYLRQIGQAHGCISTNNIFTNKRGEFMISDPWLNFEPSVYPSVNHIYFSPEKLEKVHNVVGGSLDEFTSDLFSLGMVVLETVHLEYMDDVYKKKEVNYAVLSGKVNRVSSPLIKTYVQGLLGAPRKRLSVALQIESFSYNAIRPSRSLSSSNTRGIQYANDPLKDHISSMIQAPLVTGQQEQELNRSYKQILETIVIGEQQKNTLPNAQVGKDLEATKPTSANSGKEVVRCVQPLQINALVQSKTSVQSEHSDRMSNQSKANSSQKANKIQQDPLVVSAIKVEEGASINQSSIDVKASEQPRLDQIKVQVQPVPQQPQFHLLTYDFEEPTREEKQSQKGTSPQGSSEKVSEEECTPPKKQNSSRKYNSTIIEISDSQNQSGGEDEETQFVIQKYQVGSKYEGYKKNGMRNGRGKFNYHDGGYYDGFWKNNKMNGEGKLYYPSGKLAYQGEWKQDEFHGHGKVYNDFPTKSELVNYQDFNLLEQQWEYYQGNLLSDTKQGLGRIKFSNGELFEGEFSEDKMQGKGKFYCKDGRVVAGIWRASKLIITI